MLFARGTTGSPLSTPPARERPGPAGRSSRIDASGCKRFDRPRLDARFKLRTRASSPLSYYLLLTGRMIDQLDAAFWPSGYLRRRYPATVPPCRLSIKWARQFPREPARRYRAYLPAFLDCSSRWIPWAVPGMRFSKLSSSTTNINDGRIRSRKLGKLHNWITRCHRT